MYLQNCQALLKVKYLLAGNRSIMHTKTQRENTRQL